MKDVIDLHPLTAGPTGRSPCLALGSSLQGRLFALTCPSPTLPALWSLPSISPRYLRGHEDTVTSAVFSDTELSLVTCSSTTVILWDLAVLKDKEDGEREAGITVAKDMGHISECALTLKKGDKRGLLGLGSGNSISIICLAYNMKSGIRMSLKEVHMIGTVETSSDISRFIILPTIGLLCAVGQDRALKIWSMVKSDFGKPVESLKAGRQPLTCLAYKDDILSLGDCGGLIYFYFFTKKRRKFITKVELRRGREEEENIGCDVLDIELLPLQRVEHQSEGLPSLLSKGEVVDEILNTKQNVVFVTNLGVGILNLRSGEMLQTLEFSRILHSSTFNSMAVQARIKQNKDTLTVLFLSNLDNQIKMASIKILDDDNRRRVKAEKGNILIVFFPVHI
ncbi:uncharacterized protein LOC111708826 [Eurytemora carolleeae]|uniref:uncharacterized protein LOC111708826 n=1 Tax=Eurytemora carolleeae TaxID=1294199 RepID=UPI000C768D21|nr:uncharacterized protein LOC111708826 [Eurytemora carolleeae]|eukprot:XP_023338091.1 uncharacterized protein LOC111708826 [Eurytemora affinis]